MKTLKTTITIIILTGIIAAGAIGVYAGGIGADGSFSNSYDYLSYIRVSQGMQADASSTAVTATGVTTAGKGLSDIQILAKLFELIELADAKAEAKAEAMAEAKVDARAEAPAGAAADDAETPDDSLILISVTNPKSDTVEIVYKNTYSICGVRDDDADPSEPIVLFLTRYNEELEAYEGIADVEGEESWIVGVNGVFTRSVTLEEGDNNFVLIACKVSVIEKAKAGGLEIEEDEIQIVRFTIVYRAQNVAEKISELLKDLTIANILKEIENH